VPPIPSNETPDRGRSATHRLARGLAHRQSSRKQRVGVVGSPTGRGARLFRRRGVGHGQLDLGGWWARLGEQPAAVVEEQGGVTVVADLERVLQRHGPTQGHLDVDGTAEQGRQ
jgi:hypothetical protein